MTADQCLQKLISFHSPLFKPSIEFKEQFLKIIGKFPESVIKQSYDHTVEYDAKPPTVGSFRAYCYEFSERQEIARHKEQLEKDKQTADAIYKQNGFGRDEYAKVCFKNIKLAISGQVTRKEFIENSKTLKIPMTDYIRHCELHDYDLGKPVGDGLNFKWEK